MRCEGEAQGAVAAAARDRRGREQAFLRSLRQVRLRDEVSEAEEGNWKEEMKC